MTVGTSDVSVVIPCHSERRWPELVRAVHSVLAQEPRPVEVIVTVDHNDALLARVSEELVGVTTLANRFARGASGNRNTGVFHTRTPVIAMLDGDASARPGWLAGLLAPFADAGTIGTGGAISPVWQGRRPSWFPDEFLWAVGGSFAGGPTTRTTVRNVWASSMAVRRNAFEAVGGFRTGFGKIGDRSRPEDTDLCLRMSVASGGRWVYVPDAVIDHPVLVEQETVRYFFRRCYAEGRGKVAMAGLNRGAPSLGDERGYLLRTLPRAVLAGLGGTVRGRGLRHAVRAGAIMVGVAAAGLGGAVELGSRYRSQADPVPVGRTRVQAGDR